MADTVYSLVQVITKQGILERWKVVEGQVIVLLEHFEDEDAANAKAEMLNQVVRSKERV